MKSEELTEAQLRAYKFVDSMIDKADAANGIAPLWHGWALREAFEAGWKEASPVWIPVAERLPELGEWVLVVYSGSIKRTIWVATYYNAEWILGGEETSNPAEPVTHWMPLPKLPPR